MKILSPFAVCSPIASDLHRSLLGPGDRASQILAGEARENLPVAHRLRIEKSFAFQQDPRTEAGAAIRSAAADRTRRSCGRPVAHVHGACPLHATLLAMTDFRVRFAKQKGCARQSRSPLSLDQGLFRTTSPFGNASLLRTSRLSFISTQRPFLICWTWVIGVGEVIGLGELGRRRVEDIQELVARFQRVEHLLAGQILAGLVRHNRRRSSTAL